MANTYSSSLRLIIQQDGTNQGTWGGYTNTNIASLVEQAITGVGAITVSGSSNYTLTVTNGASDEARNAVLNIAGTLTAAINVICPTVAKTYIVKNGTTGGFAITLKTASGTGISVPNGSTMLLYCDGTNVVEGVTKINGTATNATNLTGGLAGSIPYQTSAGVTSQLAAGTNGYVLTMSGGLPTWVTFTANALNPANNYQVTNFTYTGTLTGSTGIMNIGSGQLYKDASGNVGIGTSIPIYKFVVSNAGATGLEIDPVTGTNSGTNLLSYNRLTSLYKSLSMYASDMRFYGGGSSESARIDASGNVLVNQTTADTGAKLSVTGGIKGTITSGTAQATTSGTAIDFTGIPSWVKRITVMLNGVSTNGASYLLLRIGSGSVQTTGYDSTASAGTASGAFQSNTTGFILTYPAQTASSVFKGMITLCLIGSNTWVSSGNISDSVYQLVNSGSSGNVTLSGTLDRIRLTTVNGTDAFDAGSVNILYEG